MTSNAIFSGGCLCGAVRYEIRNPGGTIAICHCSHCRRQSGSAFSANLMVKDEHYRQTGETSVYQDVGDSGQPVFRNFCSVCGSPIFSRAAALAGRIFIKAGTLDDPARLLPELEIYTQNAFAWLPALPGTQRFAGPRR